MTRIIDQRMLARRHRFLVEPPGKQLLAEAKSGFRSRPAIAGRAMPVTGFRQRIHILALKPLARMKPPGTGEAFDDLNQDGHGGGK
jgi:hypothetical protein